MGKRDIYFSVISLTEENKTYSEWKKEFDNSSKNAIDRISKKLQKEKEYARKISEYMKNLPKRGWP